MPPNDKKPPIDLDAAVVGSLLKLTDSRVTPFTDQGAMPAELVDWINQADLRQTHGALTLALRRWHELRSSSE